MSAAELVLVDDRAAFAESIAELVLEHVRRHSTPDFLDVEEAATYLRCSPNAIYRKVKERRIPHHHDGKRLLFSRQELADYVMAG